ncbi:MAG: hypothetical protein MUP58_01665 [Candidatus Nanohaloarchaeota archaeon QJJ-9]|nr:hypothetical protein [Candidatus Nanohaloarchaeota archaeon QJJ-9]
MRWFFPEGINPATVDEREEFYREDFELASVKDLRFQWDKPSFYLDIGTDTTLYKPRLKERKGEIVKLRNYESLDDLKDRLVEYAPEDLWFDTRIYESDPRQSNAIWKKPEGRMLAFRLDPSRINCRKCEISKEHANTQKQKSTAFCEECFEDIAHRTAQLKVLLEKHFDDVKTYFAGRDFHIHVRDEEGFTLSEMERTELARKIAKKFPIDQEFTTEETRIRMPGSLNGLTGRKVIEVETEDLEEPLSVLYEKSEPEVVEG